VLHSVRARALACTLH